MEPRNYELIYEFVHCKGTSTHVAGFAETETEAREWVRLQHERLHAEGKSEFRDEGFECPATLCPLKVCLPSFSFREAR